MGANTPSVLGEECENGKAEDCGDTGKRERERELKEREGERERGTSPHVGWLSVNNSKIPSEEIKPRPLERKSPII